MKTEQEIKARHKEITNYLSDKSYGNYPALMAELRILEWVSK